MVSPIRNYFHSYAVKCTRSSRPTIFASKHFERDDISSSHVISPATRRSILSLLATYPIVTSTYPSSSSEIVTPKNLQVQSTFTSSEGFSFSFPETWVVAFDRSGGRGDGAITSVGDFTRFLVVAVFRTQIPNNIATLDEVTGHRLCIQPQLEDESTMRFKELYSASSDSSDRYDFEYEVEICRGEIQEGAGGVLRCLGPMGQNIPTQRKYALGRAIFGKEPGVLLTIMATTPIDKWGESEYTIRKIVESFSSS